jgi:hypothetical protein
MPSSFASDGSIATGGHDLAGFISGAPLYFHATQQQPFAAPLSSSATSAHFAFLLCLFLGIQYLDTYHLLYHPDVVGLAVDDLLQILQAVPQILDLAIVEVCRILCALFDEEASANVDENVRGGREATGDVERRRERYEKRLVRCVRADTLRDGFYTVAKFRLSCP